MTNKRKLERFFKKNIIKFSHHLMDMSTELLGERLIDRLVINSLPFNSYAIPENNPLWESALETYTTNTNTHACYLNGADKNGCCIATNVFIFADREIKHVLGEYNNDKTQFGGNIVNYLLFITAINFFHEVYHIADFINMTSDENIEFDNKYKTDKQFYDEVERRIETQSCKFVAEHFEEIFMGHMVGFKGVKKIDQ